LAQYNHVVQTQEQFGSVPKTILGENINHLVQHNSYFLVNYPKHRVQLRFTEARHGCGINIIIIIKLEKFSLEVHGSQQKEEVGINEDYSNFIYFKSEHPCVH
jgi:hypothetical protein